VHNEWEGDILYVSCNVSITTRGPVRAQLQQHVQKEWEGDILYVSCDVSIITRRPVRAEDITPKTQYFTNNNLTSHNVLTSFIKMVAILKVFCELC